jgi:PIN domain nuclease of toxin-antitoxin system
MNEILDANALIAFLRDEAGAEIVEQLLTDPANTCFVHAINLCEVFYDFHRAEGEVAAQDAIRTLTGLRIVIREDMDSAFWQEAGRLKSAHRRVSLADCLCIALAHRLAGEVVTADHHEFDPLAAAGVVATRFIR